MRQGYGYINADPERAMSSLKAMIAACAFALAATSAHAGYVFKGNDTGGIISWNPEVALIYKEVAAEHCSRYNKVAFITSIHPNYGDYVAFVCAFPRGYDPVKERYYQSVPVLRSRN
jgi:hypothetical protein